MCRINSRFAEAVAVARKSYEGRPPRPSALLRLSAITSKIISFLFEGAVISGRTLWDVIRLRVTSTRNHFKMEEEMDCNSPSDNFTLNDFEKSDRGRSTDSSFPR